MEAKFDQYFIEFFLSLNEILFVQTQNKMEIHLNAVILRFKVMTELISNKHKF